MSQNILHRRKRNTFSYVTGAFVCCLLLLAVLPIFGTVPAAAQEATPQPVVHAVLFTSPLCRFCKEIIGQKLPPLIERFGEQLQFLSVDVTTPEGERLFRAANEAAGMQGGTPQVFIVDQVMIGENILTQLPDLVEELLGQGGASLPAIPGLEDYLASSTPAQPLNPDPPNQGGLQPAGPELQPLVGDQGPVVRMVLFWMDTCGHCHFIIDEVLPPLQEKYGEQLDILQVQLVTMEDIDRLYQAGAAFEIAKEDIGVPFLIIGDRALVGSEQIPAELPGLIEDYLAQGGVDYPSLEAVTPYLPATSGQADEACVPAEPCSVDGAANPAQVANIPASNQPAPQSDGFGLAWVVLVGMVTGVGYTGLSLWKAVAQRPDASHTATWSGWRSLAFLLLVAAGLAVAGYLTYVETQMVKAVCGPVGDCNAVQASPYARLFGVLPVGLLGFAGYLALLAAWACSRLRLGWLAERAPLAVFALALSGVLFSLYLTYLEVFVIRAVCMWCLASAVIMTLLLLLAVEPARPAVD